MTNNRYDPDGILSDDQDVVITNPVQYHHLEYNGSEWVNVANLTLIDGSTIGSATTPGMLTLNATEFDINTSVNVGGTMDMDSNNIDAIGIADFDNTGTIVNALSIQSATFDGSANGSAAAPVFTVLGNGANTTGMYGTASALIFAVNGANEFTIAPAVGARGQIQTPNDIVFAGATALIGIGADQDLLSLTASDLEIDGDIHISSGSITSDSGSISFGNENLNGTGDWFTSGDFSAGSGTLNDALFNVDNATGTVGIGVAAASNALLTLNETITPAADFIAMSGVINVTTNSDAKTFGGLDFSAVVKANNDTTRIAGSCSVLTVNNPTVSLGTKTVDNVDIYCGEVDLAGGIAKTSDPIVVTDLSFLRVGLTDTFGDQVTVTNFYGINLGDVSGATNNWSIYSLGGNMSHLGNARFGSNTAPTQLLEVGTDGTVLISEADGDTYWVGDGTGIPYGSMFAHDASIAVTIGSIGVAVQVPGTFTVGQTNLATFQNTNEIAVTNAGRYLITWQMSFTAGASNQEIEGSVMVDTGAGDVFNTQASAHRKISTGTDTGSMSGTCILDLAAGDVVSLGIINETSTNTVTIEHGNLTVAHIGGT